ncbi:hypothetical protein EMEDMD4_1310063 [Sinorhizobium medicae]|uniref:Uncharacterized protein n=1 Tax=Sinorhizobium medicae TaxID=110321 RepID=A0A508WWL0_9HYPH|nr:hypothetical protein EMEDMD4_1310063 [Sinorhizobium medicae]
MRLPERFIYPLFKLVAGTQDNVKTLPSCEAKVS